MPIRPRAAPHAGERAPARNHPARVAPPRERPLLLNFDPTLSRAEQTQRRTQWVVFISLATVALIAIVGGVGLYINQIRAPSLPVAVINGDPIRHDTWQQYSALLTDELQGQAQQLQANQPSPTDATAVANQQAQLNAIQQQLSGVGDQAVNDLIDGAIVASTIPQLQKSGAPAAQLVPTSPQVDAAVAKEKQQLGVTTDGQLQQTLSSIGMSPSALRGVLTARLEEDNVKAYLSRALEPVQPQVKARIMTFGDQTKAAAALKALQGGQSWTAVNTQYQQDAAAKETTRDVAWSPKGVEDATFDQFAFGAKPFQISGILSDSGSFAIIQVEDVAPARPLSQAQADQIATKTYTDWLAKETANAQVQRFPQNMTA